ncbi:MAG TPA: DUF928 domain-containing protein, partial [Desulfatiglandales bacterium]|nr:DUF928 domain-containing protein [Desulfatiglandales bacterium]
MNNRKGWILVLFLVAAALMIYSSGTAGAQATGTGTGTEAGASGAGADQKKVTTADSTPVYKPPRRGSPGGRVGGGTRGASLEAAVSLSVLVPDHVGITLQSQPNLYWFISKKTTQPIEFTITEKDAVKPLLEA